MTDDTTKRGPGRPRKSDSYRTDQENEELDNLFADIDQSYTVKVYRQEPEWCAGYLGCFHMGPGKSVSPEEIKNRFGGRTFELVVYDPTRGGIARRRTMMIDDMPRREGEILKRDGTTEKASEAAPAQQHHPLDSVMNSHLPPHIKKAAIDYYAGIQPQEQQRKADPQDNFYQQQMMMDMMNQSRQAQMTMMQQQFDMQKRMMDAMREMDESRKPKDPMNDVNTTIKLMREINGIKTELGVGGNESLASQVLETTVPLVETALTEYLGYKRMQAQAQLAAQQNTQQNRPPLPARRPSPPEGVPLIAQAPDPLKQAQQMAEMYRNLPPHEQTAVMNAFIGALEGPTDDINGDDLDHHQNIATPLESDTIGDVGEILSVEDQALLNGHKNQNEGGDVSYSEHAASAHNNDQADREGDPGRFPIPTH